MSKLTIESLSVELLKSGFNPKETLERVKRVFPSCKTTLKGIYFYSSKYKVGLTSSQQVNTSELEAIRKEMAG